MERSNRIPSKVLCSVTAKPEKFFGCTDQMRLWSMIWGENVNHHYSNLNALQTSVPSNDKKMHRHLSTTRHSSTRQVRNSPKTSYVNVLGSRIVFRRKNLKNHFYLI